VLLSFFFLFYYSYNIYSQLASSIIIARIQLENRIEQQHGFIVKIDSFINWLKKLTNQSKTLDNQVKKFYFIV
jgi:hypothetical protein